MLYIFTRLYSIEARFAPKVFMAPNPPRWLLQSLILSLALNIGLFVALLLVASRGSDLPAPPSPAMRETARPLTNHQLLEQYMQASYFQLLTLLTDDELVEEGYAKRDLALGALVTFYHLHLERALGNLSLQKRRILIAHPQREEKIPFDLFPGLEECHYQALLHFLQTEKWPFTPFGLFQLIKRSQPFPDPTLIEALSHSAELQSLITLFKESGMQIALGPLVQMITQGDWEILQNFYSQQRLLPDLTPQRRRTLILEYLKERSPLAARIFIEADADFASKRLSDEQILLLFDLYPAQTSFLEAFAKQILISPRSDSVWKRASSTLGKALPSSEQPEEILKADDTYTVQEGDSLWKIARKCRTTVDALKESNHLESDRLRPNMILKLTPPRS